MMLISYMDDANILLQIGVSYSYDWCSMIGCKEIWKKETEDNGTYNPQEVQSKKVSNDQELIQSDPITCPQNQKGNN